MKVPGATSVSVRPANGSEKWPFIADGVELFHTGTFREGETDDDGESMQFDCSPADVEDMVQNFRKFSAGDRPALDHGITIGHEDDEDHLFSDDSVPQYGQILDLWHEWRPVDGKKQLFLLGDVGLSKDAAEMIEDGKLKRISAEIKETPPDGCDGDGYTLVRAALLGFAPAGVKRLKTLTAPKPNPSFSDHQYVRRFGDRVFTFSDLRKFAMNMNDEFDTGMGGGGEGATMSRDQCMKWLTDNGYDPDALKIDDSMTDEQLCSLVDVLDGIAGNTDATDGKEDFADEEMLEEDEGEMADPDAEMEDEEMAASAPRRFSDELHQLRRDVVTLSRIVQANTATNRALERTGKSLSRGKARDQIHQFCEQMVRERKMSRAAAEPPSRENPYGGEDFSRLVRSLSDKRLHTFSHRGRKVRKSTLEVEMDAIRNRRPQIFSEIMRGPQASSTGNLSPFAAAAKKRMDAQLARAKK
jgi:hypothetical protein